MQLIIRLIWIAVYFIDTIYQLMEKKLKIGQCLSHLRDNSWTKTIDSRIIVEQQSICIFEILVWSSKPPNVLQSEALFYWPKESRRW